MDYVFPSDQDRAENQQLDEACTCIEHLLDQQGTQNKEIPACGKCGSTDLGWQAHSMVNGSTPDGKLRANEVSSLFVLGCNYCSETLDTMTADETAQRLTLEDTNAS